MPLMEWSERYVLGFAAMDKTHQEFVEIVSRMADLPDVSLAAGFDELLIHTIAHFERENRWMTESGFPPDQCHTGEHERVVAGDHVQGRAIIEELPSWFETHASTMDAALAWFMQRPGSAPKADISTQEGDTPQTLR